MHPDDYPQQEPFSPPARLYHEEVMRRGNFSTGEEIAYGSDAYQRILIWRSPNPTGILLAFIHGGGWTNGYKEWLAFMAPAFTEAGIVFASIGYRLAPQHAFPVGFNDACSGVALFAEHARPYGADPNHLFVGGRSAGGHLAALMALTRPELGARGCLPVSGVYDFGPASGLPARPRFLGPANSGNELTASPIANIGERPIPFFIAHGTDDFPHLIVQAERMERALRVAGGEVERLALKGHDHFAAGHAAGEAEGSWLPRAVNWMSRHLHSFA